MERVATWLYAHDMQDFDPERDNYWERYASAVLRTIADEIERHPEISDHGNGALHVADWLRKEASHGPSSDAEPLYTADVALLMAAERLEAEADARRELSVRGVDGPFRTVAAYLRTLTDSERPR